MLIKHYLNSDYIVMDTETDQTTLHQFTLCGITGKWTKEEEVLV
jgi:hypothetical protein